MTRLKFEMHHKVSVNVQAHVVFLFRVGEKIERTLKWHTSEMNEQQ